MLRRLRRAAFASVFAWFLLGLASCASESSPPSPDPSLDDSGSWYLLEQWPHDGHPVASDRFLVFSDSATVVTRRRLADQAERVLTDIVTELGIGEQELALPAGQDKIHVFAFEDRSPDWAGKAYFGGLLVSSPDRRSVLGLVRTDPTRYEAILKHELVHVVTESLLRSASLSEPPLVPVWYFEGLAEMISGGTGAGVVMGRDHLDYLTSKYGELNPVSFVSGEDFEGGPSAYAEYHYPMSQLAVQFLFDDDGFGKSPPDATAMLRDLARGTEFDDAFARRMGIPVPTYEDSFFELMNDYLPARSRALAFSPVGLYLVAVVAVGLALAIVVRSTRTQSNIPSPAQGTTEFRRGRVVAFVFGSWVAVASTISLGLFLIGLLEIGGDWSLSATTKTIGVVVLLGYLATCSAVVAWAMNSHKRRSWASWVIPLLAFASAVIAAGIIIAIV